MMTASNQSVIPPGTVPTTKANLTASCSTSIWGTPEVDRLICALDARDMGISAIINRVKRQFPALQNHVVTANMVEKRIRLLDQRVDIDYFKHGIGLASTSIETGLSGTRGTKHGLAIHQNNGEAWEAKSNSSGVGRSGDGVGSKKDSAHEYHLRKTAEQDVVGTFSGTATTERTRAAKLGLAIHGVQGVAKPLSRSRSGKQREFGNEYRMRNAVVNIPQGNGSNWENIKP